MQADVAVIGAGVIGGATAWELARAGASVLLIDKAHPPAGATASGASAGGVRQQNRLAPEFALARRAVTHFWPQLSDMLGYDVEYHRTGMTIITDEPEHQALLDARVAREQANGLEIEMLYGQELHALIPGLHPALIAGAYCRTDGKANPMRTAKAFALAAERAGARTLLGTAVTGFETREGKLARIQTSAGPVEARQVVIAAGVWTPRLAGMLGVTLPIRTGPIQMLVTERRPHILDQTLGWIGRGISLKQAPSGGFVIGGGWPGRGDSSGRNQTLQGSIVGSARIATSLIPALKNVALVRAWLGLEAFCPDDMPIIGRLPGYENVRIAAGFSGHGFCLAPAVGEAIGQEIVSGKPLPVLAPFAAERFAMEFLVRQA